MSKTQATGPGRRPILAIAGAALGTLFVWYDFFLFVSLGGLIGAKFLPAGNGADGYVFALFAVAAGLVMRPVGALVFGRLADGKGRKPALLASILLMAAATLIVALLPTRAQIGLAAPIALIVLRLLQGLALGGEPVTAAVYAAELAPTGRRGLWTGVIQMAGTLGLALALGVALSLRGLLGETGFESWGWRIPFGLSAVLIGIWAWLRLALAESPVGEAVGENRKPVAEALANPANLKRLGLALLGLAAGQAIVWQVGQLYALSFLQGVLHVDATVAEGLMLPALLAGAPFFVLFGWLSDKVGRKWIVMAGCALFASAVIPLFSLLINAAEPALARARAGAEVVLIADPRDCSVQFDPTDRTVFKTSCDIATDFLVRAGIPFKVERAYPHQMAGVQVGTSPTGYIDSFRGERLSAKDFEAASNDFAGRLGGALNQAHYPASAAGILIDKPQTIGLLFVLVLLAAMSGGPALAMLVEMFPARVRGVSVSLTYQIAHAWVGGLLPAAAFAVFGIIGHPEMGLLYAVFFAGLTVVVGAINLAETRLIDITV